MINVETVLLAILVFALIVVRREWLWERRFWSLAIGVLIWLCIIGRSQLRVYLAEPADCNQPCRSLDSGCSPIALNLEVKNVDARVNRYPYIWYRATLTNTSCATLSMRADFFHFQDYFGNDQRAREEVYFRFWDSAGQEITVAEGEFRSDGIHVSSGPASSPVVWTTLAHDTSWTPPTKSDYEKQRNQPWESAKNGSSDFKSRPYVGEKPSEILPYFTDASVYSETFRKIDQYGYLDIAPGGELISQPTKYWPHRSVMKEVHTEKFDGSVWGAEEVKTPRPIAPLPPPGYRLVQIFVFRRPGTYRLQLAFNEDVWTKSHLRIESRQTLFQRLMWALGRCLYVLPENNPKQYRIQASSGLVDVKVKP